MTKKKLVMYGSVLAVFLVFWGVYAVLTMRAVDQASQQSLRETTNTLILQVEKGLDYQAKDLAYTLGELEGAASKEALADMLATKETATHSFAVADADGTLYTTGGERINQALAASTLKSVDMDGSVFLSLVDNTLGLDGVALVVPYAGLPGTYVVEIYTLEAYTQLLSDSFAFAPEAISVFNEWGSELYNSTGEGTDAIAVQELRNGALEYTRDAASTELIQKTGGSQTYNVFLNLGRPDGWFLGVRIEASQAVPMYSSILQTSILALVSWMLLIALIIFLDITNDKEKKKELLRVSKIDSLTGLINSTGMEEEITEFFKRHSMTDYSLVVLDLVAFSRFNTMFGSVSGDSLLGVIGQTLQKYYHCGTRMGGDVFGFLAKTEQDLSQTAEDKILESIERELGKQYLQVISFKFGIFPIMDTKHTFRQIYDGAMLALKDAKNIPENEVVYDSDLQQSVDLKRNIEINMLHALSGDEFLVYIQPKFSVKTLECCGGEALVRWQSEQMGFLAPDQFIPLFEKNGFIVEVDFYMLASVLDLLQKEIDAGRKPYPISVNQSRVTITFPNYMERLRSLVEEYSVPLNLVELEITESTLENDSDSVIPIITIMKDLGFTVAMDDFGTGFSSLNTLRRLPVDVLKIDKEFLRESDSSGRSRKIIRNITNMSKELGITVVCEGVETKNQVDFLKDADCDIAQGYYFARPMPQEEYEKTYLLG